jgi:hypothetical protein
LACGQKAALYKKDVLKAAFRGGLFFKSGIGKDPLRSPEAAGGPAPGWKGRPSELSGPEPSACGS